MINVPVQISLGNPLHILGRDQSPKVEDNLVRFVPAKPYPARVGDPIRAVNAAGITFPLKYNGKTTRKPATVHRAEQCVAFTFRLYPIRGLRPEPRNLHA